MGRGTNYVKRPTTLDGVELAKKLLFHTNKILKNPKVFKPERDYQDRMLVKIYDTALEILSKAVTANEIFVGENPALARERLTLQSFAVASCNTFLDLQAAAKSQFSLRNRKFWHWAKMARETKAKLKAWREADVKRYKPLLDAAGAYGISPEAAAGGAGESGRRLISSLGG